MSYSFSARGASRLEAQSDATNKLDLVIQQQPVHAKDREVALATLRAHLDLLAEATPDEDVVVSMNGSIGVQNFGATAGERVTNTSTGVSVYVTKR